MMETGVTNGETRQHNRPVSFAGTGLDEVDGASYLGSRPATATSTSSKGGRQLTFRDYGEKIKELEGENFQLKVRLHLIEQSKYGKQRNPSAQQVQLNSSGQDGLTVATNEIVSEFQQLKKDNEALNLKLVTAENQRLRLEEERDEILRREQLQLSRNEELSHKLDVLDRELALTKLKKDEEEDEIEKCVKAFNSFGGIGNSSHNNNNHLLNPTVEQNNILQTANEKLESQLRTLKHDSEILKREVDGLQAETKQKGAEIHKLSQKAYKRRDQINQLKEENYALNLKVTSTCETMKEMGFRFNGMNIQYQDLLSERSMLKETVSSLNTALEQAEHEILQLKRQNDILEDKSKMSDRLHREYEKLVAEMKSLRAICPVDETYERFVTVGLTSSVSHQEIREDPSPDLGIETDQEALAQQLGSASSGNMVPESSNSSKALLKQKASEDLDKEELKRINKNLAYKLKHTKQTLDSTVSKLQKTTKEKEDFEKAICRQLHRTHNLLEDAQQSLEREQNAQLLHYSQQETNLASQTQSQNVDNSFDQLSQKRSNFV